MMVSLDKLSSRYSLLPSQALQYATTFDLQILDLGIRYEHVLKQKQNGTYVKPVPQLSQEEMLKILAETRKNGEGK
jgi:hypothetical protein